MTEKAPEELAAEIQATRERLTATIDALTARADVRTRARLAINRRLRALGERSSRIRARMRRGRGQN